MSARLQRPYEHLHPTEHEQRLDVDGMVVGQPTVLGVGSQERVAEILVVGSCLELPEGDGEVVQMIAPAAVVEVDRPYGGVMEQEVLVVQITVDETERARRIRKLPGRRPDHFQRFCEQRR